MKNIKLTLVIIFTFVLNVFTYSAAYLGIPSSSGYSFYEYWSYIGSNNIDHWANHSETWYLNTSGWSNEGLSIGDVENQMIAAHNTWSSSQVSTTDLTFTYGYRTTDQWGEDGKCTIQMVQAGDPAYDYNGPFYGGNSGGGGITIIKVNANYELIEADILQNGKNQNWNLTKVLWNITHEIGHTIGLADLPINQPETMSIYCSGDPSTLELDDIAGVSFLYGGKITENTSLSYYTANYFNWDVEVVNGNTLTIPSGATLKFANGVGLNVKGNLTAAGNPSQLITFTSKSGSTPGSWGTITFSGSSASNLNYARVTFGGGIQCMNGANVTIQNSYIDTCTNGIYIYNSAPQILTNHILEPQQNGIYGEASGMYPSVIDNTIIKTTASGSYYHNYQGIWFTNNTTVYAAHNDVSGFLWGAYFSGGVHAIFNTSSYVTHNPNNRFRYNSYGIAAGYGSYCYAGVSYNLSFYNSIHDNTTYDAYSYQNSTVIAQSDYWGTNGPKQYVEYGSVLDISNNLSSDPWGTSSNSPAIKQTNNLLTASYSTSANRSQVIQPADSNLSDIFAGISFENAGRIEDAIACYKNMIANDNNAGFALTELAAINNKYSRNDMLSYFANIPVVNKHYPLALKLIADNDLQNNKFDEAISIYDKLITNYPNDYQGINAKFEKLFAYLNIKNDKIKATQILSNIKAMNLTDQEWAMRTEAAEGLLGLAGNSATKNQAATSNQNNEVNNPPKEYALFANYPNPFNPSTIISYQIPKDGMVTLKVFDALGREVKTLVNGFKSQGRYSVSFDASKLASGVYFYKIESGSFQSVKKMMLLK